MLQVETRQLSYSAAGRCLISGIDMIVRPGEVLAIVGPSGAGKSTFLRLLNRLNEPTSGTVLINGSDYRAMLARKLRQQVGMVMQRPFLFPGTVAANIEFGPGQSGQPIDRHEIGRLLQFVGLPEYGDRDVTTLSGGEAQRVSLARTMANRPEVLLLDEPTSALDHVSTERVEDLVRTVNRKHGVTCVMVTHNREQALRMADRTMLLSAGRLVSLGPTKDVLDAAA
jgi:putative ABC transport system ATP-binding protein